GLLRAMGLAMVAESVGSALYHICPNSAAFQFDTPFIQVLIVLILLKLYAARHGATEAHWAFALIGVILAIDFAATAANHQQATKICLLVAHLLSVLFAEVQIYFGGHIDISVRRPMQSIKIMRKLIGTEIGHKHYQPLFARRLIMLAFIFGVNALFAGYLFVIDPLNANMSVLSILVINLIAYFAYYVVNKIISKETLSLTAWASLAAALLLWCAAAIFFTHKNTDWALAPAQSRALNKDCVLFDFFDAHDLWHMTSSMAAFFSLIAVAVIDDNQLTVPRSQISIF
uniref:Uncharacterized protein n=1 Tax=Plectus sambesii TaxID=2011161 RepID=A0A914WTW0_9BILA